MSGNSRIKVLHVLTDSNIGGAGTYVANVLKNCDPEKLDLSVVIPHGSAAKKLMSGRVIEADIAPDRSMDLRSVKTLRRLIRTEKPDIVHAHGSASARIAAKGLCKSVFTKHTLSSGGGLASRLVYRAVGGYAIAVSEAARQNLLSLGFKESRIFTVPNGVADMGVPTPEKRAEAKQSFGIDAAKFVVGCVARFSPVKDYETWLNAAALALEKNDRLAFLLCGDGDTLSAMKAHAKRLGISRNCVFPGAVYDVSRAYHAMDLYCGASVAESFGQSLVEAWSAGLPSVTSKAPGFMEISQDGVSSLFCDAGEPRQFADAILKIYNDPALAALLSSGGKKRYNEKYDCETFARNLEAVYAKIKG